MPKSELHNPLVFPVNGTDYFYLSHRSEFVGRHQHFVEALNIFGRNPSTTTSELSEQLNMDLAEAEFLRSQLAELKLVDSKEIEMGLYQPSSLSVYIELTEACNFSCSGCATSVDVNSQAAEHMTSDYLAQQLRSIYASAHEHGFESVKLKYAGGEPLLPKITPLIISSQEEIEKLEGEFGLETDQVVLTNGVFLKDQLPKLNDITNLRFAISIWGLPQTNDGLRLGSGQNTYRKIQEGLWATEASGNGFNVQHTITPMNAADFPAFLETMWDTRSDNFIGTDPETKTQYITRPIPVSFSIFRPQNEFQLEQMQLMDGYAQITEGILAGIEYAQELINDGIIPPSFLVDFDYLNFENTKLTTCGSGINYIAIGPNKEAQPCHQLLHISPKTELVSQNILEEVNQKHNPVITADEDLPNTLDRQTQILLALHGGGGCPLVNELEKQVGAAVDQVYAKIAPAILGVLAS